MNQPNSEPIMNQPIIKPSRWRQDKLIADWKGDGWPIRRHNRTSGKAGYHVIATVNSETNAKQLASSANDGLSMWKYYTTPLDALPEKKCLMCGKPFVPKLSESIACDKCLKSCKKKDGRP